jgi:hypothetical protein
MACLAGHREVCPAVVIHITCGEGRPSNAQAAPERAKAPYFAAHPCLVCRAVSMLPFFHRNVGKFPSLLQ